jgi:hypothetical protein
MPSRYLSHINISSKKLYRIVQESTNLKRMWASNGGPGPPYISGAKGIGVMRPMEFYFLNWLSVEDSRPQALESLKSPFEKGGFRDRFVIQSLGIFEGAPNEQTVLAKRRAIREDQTVVAG